VRAAQPLSYRPTDPLLALLEGFLSSEQTRRIPALAAHLFDFGVERIN
jgi:hypothetical protein